MQNALASAATVARAADALLERAEDPEKMLAALIREMEDALGEAREAAAGILDDQKRFRRRSAARQSPSAFRAGMCPPHTQVTAPNNST